MDEPSLTPGWSFLAQEGTPSEIEEQIDEIMTSSPEQVLPGSSRTSGSIVKRQRETESAGRPQKRQKQGTGSSRQNERGSSSNDHGPRAWQGGPSRREDKRLEDTEMRSDGPSSSRAHPLRPQEQISSSREPSSSRPASRDQRQGSPDREVITFPDSPPQIARKTTGRGPRASAVKAQQVPDEVIEISSDSDEEDTRTARKRAIPAQSRRSRRASGARAAETVSAPVANVTWLEFAECLKVACGADEPSTSTSRPASASTAGPTRSRPAPPPKPEPRSASAARPATKGKAESSRPSSSSAPASRPASSASKGKARERPATSGSSLSSSATRPVPSASKGKARQKPETSESSTSTSSSCSSSSDSPAPVSKGKSPQKSPQKATLDGFVYNLGKRPSNVDRRHLDEALGINPPKKEPVSPVKKPRRNTGTSSGDLSAVIQQAFIRNANPSSSSRKKAAEAPKVAVDSSLGASKDTAIDLTALDSDSDSSPPAPPAPPPLPRKTLSNHTLWSNGSTPPSSTSASASAPTSSAPSSSHPQRAIPALPQRNKISPPSFVAAGAKPAPLARNATSANVPHRPSTLAQSPMRRHTMPAPLDMEDEPPITRIAATSIKATRAPGSGLPSSESESSSSSSSSYDSSPPPEPMTMPAALNEIPPLNLAQASRPAVAASKALAPVAGPSRPAAVTGEEPNPTAGPSIEELLAAGVTTEPEPAVQSGPIIYEISSDDEENESEEEEEEEEAADDTSRGMAYAPGPAISEVVQDNPAFSDYREDSDAAFPELGADEDEDENDGDADEEGSDGRDNDSSDSDGIMEVDNLLAAPSRGVSLSPEVDALLGRSSATPDSPGTFIQRTDLIMGKLQDDLANMGDTGGPSVGKLTPRDVSSELEDVTEALGGQTLKTKSPSDRAEGSRPQSRTGLLTSSRPSSAGGSDKLPTPPAASEGDGFSDFYVSDDPTSMPMPIPPSASTSAGRRSSTSSSDLSSMPQTPAPTEILPVLPPKAAPKSYGGVQATTFSDYRETYMPVVRYTEDLPSELHNQINSYSEHFRGSRTLPSVLQASITFNTMEDEPHAPPIEILNKVDSEPTPPWEFYYTNHIYHAPGVPLPDVVNLRGCDCVGKCDPNSKTCACVKKQKAYFHPNDSGFVYDKTGKLKRGFPGYPIVECNDLCGCDEECMNRVVQHGRKVQISIQKTEEKGWGVFAGPKPIPAGTFLGIYSGEILTEEESAKRGEVYNEYGRTYLFDIDYYHIGDDGMYTMDAYHAGNFTRFLNHSCEPNCRIFACYINEANILKPLLAVYAIRDVGAYEEICFNYNGSYPEDDGDDDEEPGPSQETSNGKAKAPVYQNCRCGAKNCTGKVFR